MVENLPTVQETQVRSLDWDDPLEKRGWQPTPVFLPGEFHGQRSLVGYSPWGPKELDTTDCLTLSLFLTFLFSEFLLFLSFGICVTSTSLVFLPNSSFCSPVEWSP